MKLHLSAARPQSPVPREPYNTWLHPRGHVWAAFFHAPDGYLIRFPGLADFALSADCRLADCSPVPGAPEATLRHLFANQIVPLGLSFQGKLVLHASAVDIAGEAVAFAAPSGRGKSTLAASFATHACAFLTDDALLLRHQEACGHWVMPSQPSLRLWHDSRDSVAPAAALAGIAPGPGAKPRLAAGPGLEHCHSERLLKLAYFLGEGDTDEIIIRPTSQAQALIHWVRNSFQLDPTHSEMLARQFDQLSLLAGAVPTFHLDFPRRYDVLDQVREAILQNSTGPVRRITDASGEPS